MARNQRAESYKGGHQRVSFGSKPGAPDGYPYNQGQRMDLNKLSSPPRKPRLELRQDPPCRKPPPRQLYPTDTEIIRRREERAAKRKTAKAAIEAAKKGTE